MLGNEKVQKFFITYGRYLDLGISIDGTKECHDLNRVDIHGNGTYDSIVKNLEFIKKHISSQHLSVKATFNHDTIKYYKDSIIHLIELGFENIVANTVYEEYWDEDDFENIYFQLKDVANYLLDNNLEDIVYIQQINKYGSNYKKNPLCTSKESNHCGSCEHMMCLGMDKIIYGCHRFSTSGTHRIGTIDDCGNIVIDNTDFIDDVKNQYISYPDECVKCDFHAICGTCAAIPYEMNISAKEWLHQKRQCGFTKAVGYAICYFAYRIEEAKKKLLTNE